MVCLQIAATMLGLTGPEALPDALESRLVRINELIGLCQSGWWGERDPGLRSRQVVAMVIEQWQREDTC